MNDGASTDAATNTALPAGPGPSRVAARPGASALPALPPWEAIVAEARRLGFGSAGVADIDLSAAEPGLQAWLAAGFHGRMDYMARHGLTRARPAELIPGTRSAILVAMDYAPDDPAWIDAAWQTLAAPERAFISRYALGRDYHKVVRSRLQRLAEWLQDAAGRHGHRVFCDSAPVLEVELATRAGLGWRGKNTLLLSADRGSMFFIGTLYTSLALAPTAADPSALDTAPAGHCGRCRRCLDVCPTRAIVAPYRLDARRCISYLTIEYDGVIDGELAVAIGNRIYGCDDCQLVCPWNRFARPPATAEFAAREGLDAATLSELFAWSSDEFEHRLRGSAIRRIGHRRWQRNLAVAMGNAIAAGADGDGAIEAALRAWLLAGPAMRDPVVESQVRQALELADRSRGAGVRAPARPVAGELEGVSPRR
jgi:epoxyqueuosine reductase